MNNNRVTYTAVASLDNSKGDVIPYMTLISAIKVAEVKNALLVPNAALAFAAKCDNPLAPPPRHWNENQAPVFVPRKEDMRGAAQTRSYRSQVDRSRRWRRQGRNRSGRRQLAALGPIDVFLALKDSWPTTAAGFNFVWRTLLILTAIACCVLAGPVRQARQQRVVLDSVHGVGGAVLFDWENPGMEFDPFVWSGGQAFYLASGRVYFSVSELGRPNPSPPGPTWLRRLLGDEYFQSVKIVDLGVYMGGGAPERVTNNTLQTVCDLKSVVWIEMDGAKNVDDSGLAELERVPQLQRLFADGVPITDDGMKHIGRLTQLQYLSVDSPLVTDEGVKAIRGLTHLRYLYLGHTKITERALEYLRVMEEPPEVYVPGTGIPERMAERYNSQFPHSWIIVAEPGLVG